MSTKDPNIIGRIRSIQEMEKETKKTMEKFMMALNQHVDVDYAEVLEEKENQLISLRKELNKSKEEISVMRQKIDSLMERNELLTKSEASHLEEKIQIQKTLIENDHLIDSLQAELQNQLRTMDSELEQKKSLVSKLELDYIELKSKYEESVDNVSSVRCENDELHSALQALHCEIAGLNKEMKEIREKEITTSKQKKETYLKLEERNMDLARAMQEKKVLEDKLHVLQDDFRQKLNEECIHREKNQVEMETLAKERDIVQGSMAKMSLKIRQQQETHQELNQLLLSMREENQEMMEVNDSLKSKVEGNERQIKELKEEARASQEQLQELQEKCHVQESEMKRLQNLIKELEDSQTKSGSENRILTSKLESFQKLQQDYARLQNQSKREREEWHEKFNTLKESHELESRKYLSENVRRENLLEEKSKLEVELDLIRSEKQELLETIELLNRNLREAERMKEESLEMNRNQHKESANRMIDFSQKNSQLTAELLIVREQLQQMQNHEQELIHGNQDLSQKVDRLETINKELKSKISQLEDRMELSEGKIQALKGEKEALLDRRNEETLALKSSYEEMKNSQDKIIEELRTLIDNERNNHATTLKQCHDNYREEKDKIRRQLQNEYQSQLQDFQVRLENGKKEFVEKVFTLQQSLQENQRLLEQNIQESQKWKKDYHDVVEVLEIEREEARLHGHEKVKSFDEESRRWQVQCQSLREEISELRAREGSMQADLKWTKEQWMQLQEEYSNRLESADHQQIFQQQKIEQLQRQVNDLEREKQEWQGQLKGKDAEIKLLKEQQDKEMSRLKRRNEVLRETVSQLTSTSTSTNASMGLSTPSTPLTTQLSTPWSTPGSYYTPSSTPPPGSGNVGSTSKDLSRMFSPGAKGSTINMGSNSSSLSPNSVASAQSIIFNYPTSNSVSTPFKNRNENENENEHENEHENESENDNIHENRSEKGLLKKASKRVGIKFDLTPRHDTISVVSATNNNSHGNNSSIDHSRNISGFSTSPPSILKSMKTVENQSSPECYDICNNDEKDEIPKSFQFRLPIRHSSAPSHLGFKGLLEQDIEANKKIQENQSKDESDDDDDIDEDDIEVYTDRSGVISSRSNVVDDSRYISSFGNHKPKSAPSLRSNISMNNPRTSINEDYESNIRFHSTEEAWEAADLVSSELNSQEYLKKLNPNSGEIINELDSKGLSKPLVVSPRKEINSSSTLIGDSKSSSFLSSSSTSSMISSSSPSTPPSSIPITPIHERLDIGDQDSSNSLLNSASKANLSFTKKIRESVESSKDWMLNHSPSRCSHSSPRLTQETDNIENKEGETSCRSSSLTQDSLSMTPPRNQESRLTDREVIDLLNSSSSSWMKTIREDSNRSAKDELATKTNTPKKTKKNKTGSSPAKKKKSTDQQLPKDSIENSTVVSTTSLLNRLRGEDDDVWDIMERNVDSGNGSGSNSSMKGKNNITSFTSPSKPSTILSTPSKSSLAGTGRDDGASVGIVESSIGSSMKNSSRSPFSLNWWKKS